MPGGTCAPGGVVALLAYAREHLFVYGLEGYFPTNHAHFAAGHQATDELFAELPGAVIIPCPTPIRSTSHCR